MLIYSMFFSVCMYCRETKYIVQHMILSKKIYFMKTLDQHRRVRNNRNSKKSVFLYVRKRHLLMIEKVVSKFEGRLLLWLIHSRFLDIITSLQKLFSYPELNHLCFKACVLYYYNETSFCNSCYISKFKIRPRFGGIVAHVSSASDTSEAVSVTKTNAEDNEKSEMESILHAVIGSVHSKPLFFSATIIVY